MSNKIPRTANKLEVEFLTHTSLGDKGVKVDCRKTENGWSGNFQGKNYHIFLEHLRNENICKVKVIS